LMIVSAAPFSSPATDTTLGPLSRASYHRADGVR
jgi:hypothetical protein